MRLSRSGDLTLLVFLYSFSVTESNTPFDVGAKVRIRRKRLKYVINGQAMRIGINNDHYRIL